MNTLNQRSFLNGILSMTDINLFFMFFFSLVFKGTPWKKK